MADTKHTHENEDMAGFSYYADTLEALFHFKDARLAYAPLTPIVLRRCRETGCKTPRLVASPKGKDYVSLIWEA